jgi:hypothetical protein
MALRKIPILTCLAEEASKDAQRRSDDRQFPAFAGMTAEVGGAMGISGQGRRI